MQKVGEFISCWTAEIDQMVRKQVEVIEQYKDALGLMATHARIRNYWREEFALAGCCWCSSSGSWPFLRRRSTPACSRW